MYNSLYEYEFNFLFERLQPLHYTSYMYSRRIKIIIYVWWQSYNFHLMVILSPHNFYMFFLLKKNKFHFRFISTTLTFLFDTFWSGSAECYTSEWLLYFERRHLYEIEFSTTNFPHRYPKRPPALLIRLMCLVFDTPFIFHTFDPFYVDIIIVIIMLEIHVCVCEQQKRQRETSIVYFMYLFTFIVLSG